ncbi:MAG TPA: LytTR family DNA-binding domain-containing protein [Candidatus Babeliaceae bacterium]|nr:LytTR family DNA-binding domain-containing protein [Candidatus Babeliaceae bacterium]
MTEAIQIKYNDLLFRIIISLVAAHIIVAFGATQSFFHLLINWKYYRSLLPSVVIAFLLISEVYLATVKLDKRFDWRDSTAARIGLQLLFGLTVPAITAFLLATVYFAAFGYNILRNTYYLEFDFPVIIILLLLLNVYYLAFYFFRRWQLSEQEKTIVMIPQPAEKQKSVYMVHKGSKSVPIPLENICYFYHESSLNFLRTFEKEDFLITQPLDEVQKQLPDKQFFRVNRQMIVNFLSCKHFELLQYGRLELILNPKPKETVIVSQRRTKAFKEWFGK